MALDLRALCLWCQSGRCVESVSSIRTFERAAQSETSASPTRPSGRARPASLPRAGQTLGSLQPPPDLGSRHQLRPHARQLDIVQAPLFREPYPLELPRQTSEGTVLCQALLEATWLLSWPDQASYTVGGGSGGVRKGCAHRSLVLRISDAGSGQLVSAGEGAPGAARNY